MEITRENLEAVLNQFAATIVQRKGIQIQPHQFLLVLTDNTPNDFITKAGNPVVITIRMSIFAEAIMKRNLIDFKYQLESALRVAPRMLRSLSLVPVSEYLRKDADEKRWRKTNNIRNLPPRIPQEDIKFVTQLSVTAIHKPTGLKITLTGNTNAEWRLQEQAEEALCRLVDDNKKEKGDANS